MLYKIWKIVSNFLIVCLGACVFVSLSNAKIFDKGYSYEEKALYEYPLAGFDDMCVDDENIYCFNQYLQAVNVYGKNGNFEYSLKVPSRRKGRGCIYIKDKYFCIRNDYDDVYQYKNGEFLYKGTLELDEDDERGIYQIIDKEGCIVASKDYTEYSELVGFFDDEIITEEDWEADIFECDWLVEDENGDVYEVNLLRTKLMKNGQTLREQPFHQSLTCSTVLSTLCFFAIALLQRLVEWIVEGRNA